MNTRRDLLKAAASLPLLPLAALPGCAVPEFQPHQRTPARLAGLVLAARLAAMAALKSGVVTGRDQLSAAARATMRTALRRARLCWSKA